MYPAPPDSNSDSIAANRRGLSDNMSVDLKQQLELKDYLGALAVWCIFFAVLFILSAIFNFVCIKKDDDITALERWGHKKNVGMRLGPHRRSMVARQIPQQIHD